MPLDLVLKNALVLDGTGAEAFPADIGLSGGHIETVDRFLEVTACVCAHKGVVIRRPDAGTVSSDQVAVTRNSRDAVYRHAPGPPDRLDYDDCSDLLRTVLSGSNRPDGG